MGRDGDGVRVARGKRARRLDAAIAVLGEARTPGGGTRRRQTVQADGRPVEEEEMRAAPREGPCAGLIIPYPRKIPDGHWCLRSCLL
jgi:hypothetical protein